MPMTRDGYVPPKKSGEYREVLTCRGQPRCVKTGQRRREAQADGCTICERTYEYVESP